MSLYTYIYISSFTIWVIIEQVINICLGTGLQENSAGRREVVCRRTFNWQHWKKLFGVFGAGERDGGWSQMVGDGCGYLGTGDKGGVREKAGWMEEGRREERERVVGETEGRNLQVLGAEGHEAANCSRERGRMRPESTNWTRPIQYLQ